MSDNIRKYEDRSIKLHWKFPAQSPDIQENAIMHFREQSSTVQAQFELSPDLLEMPKSPMITHEETEYFQHHQHIEKCIPAEFTPPSSKILFI